MKSGAFSKTLLLMAKILGLIIGGGAVCFILLVLAYMIPVRDSIVETSRDLLAREGWYPRATIQEAMKYDYFHSEYPDVLDGNSDAIILATSAQKPLESPVLQAMTGYNEYFYGTYERYWHGYVVVLRPLLLLFQYDDIRILNMCLQIGLMIALAILMHKRHGALKTVSVVCAYLLMMPIAVQEGLQYTPVFFISFGAMFLLLKFPEFFARNNRDILLFVLIGMLTSYMDLLTSPLCTWGLPVMVWILDERYPKKCLGQLAKVVFTGLAWIAGYGCLWYQKWVYASIILKDNIIAKAFEEVLLRVESGQVEAKGISYRWGAVRVNWEHYATKVFALILILWTVALIVCLLSRKVKSDTKRLSYLLVALSSVVWYMVLSNHTAGHEFFTYRICTVMLLAYMITVADIIVTSEKTSINRVIMTAVVMVVMGIASVGLMCLMTEEHEGFSGNRLSDEILVGEDGLRQGFSPVSRRIDGFAIGLKSESTNGQYVIRLTHDDQVLDTVTIDIASTDGAQWHEIPVKWRVKPFEKYNILVEAVDNNAPVYALITQDEVALTEYDYAMTGSGAELTGQLLGRITYVTIPGTEYMKIFYIITWFGVLMMIYSCVVPNIVLKKKVSVE